MSLTLNTDIDVFMMNIVYFKEEIGTLLGGNYIGNRRLFTILSLTTGSVIIDSQMTVPPG